jgi:hypothetical protein
MKSGSDNFGRVIHFRRFILFLSITLGLVAALSPVALAAQAPQAVAGALYRQ